MRIYKIFRSEEWQALDRDGETDGAPVDLADGYIHFSTAAQVAETAGKYFAGVEGLVLAELESDALGPQIRWEPARGGVLFPHLYRRLRRTEVLRTWPLPLGDDGKHVFPEDLA